MTAAMMELTRSYDLLARSRAIGLTGLPILLCVERCRLAREAYLAAARAERRLARIASSELAEGVV
jgi:hypothetical protein